MDAQLVINGFCGDEYGVLQAELVQVRKNILGVSPTDMGSGVMRNAITCDA